MKIRMFYVSNSSSSSFILESDDVSEFHKAGMHYVKAYSISKIKENFRNAIEYIKNNGEHKWNNDYIYEHFMKDCPEWMTIYSFDADNPTIPDEINELSDCDYLTSEIDRDLIYEVFNDSYHPVHGSELFSMDL